MTEPEWTLEQAAEVVLEQFVTLLDGCDDDDTVRPALVLEALRQIYAPSMEVKWPEGLTAGEMRERILDARRRLAEGEQVP